MNTIFPHNSLSTNDFLQEYWQKKPLLLRQVWPDFRSPIDAELLAGMACEPDYESRIILEHSGQSPWELRYGPFNDEDFAQLPDTHWTLLVQDVDKYVPEVAALLEAFQFIPNWRIDDIMISYAAPHGSVGPHQDAYDVFLVQGEGRRRWQISMLDNDQPALRTDTDLRILSQFEPQQEWILEPGDCLYLPPGVAHFGVAMEECMTFSIGFRAPTARELIGGYLEFAIERTEEHIRYQDSDLTIQHNAGEISTQSIAKVTALLQQNLSLTQDTITQWFGRFITEPKPHFELEPPEHPIDNPTLLKALIDGQRLLRSELVRCSFSALNNGQILLFMDGQHYKLRDQAVTLGQILASNHSISYPQIANLIKHDYVISWLTKFYNFGYLYLK